MHTLLQGPRVVDRTIRPPRVAYIVENIDQCDAFVQVCSLTWGGKHFCVVPYDRSAGLSEEWRRVLRLYDPDTVVSCVELDEAEQEELLGVATGRVPKAGQQRKQKIVVWTNLAPDGEAIWGQSLYSALLGVGAYERRERFPAALVPDIPAGHPLELYIRARYGCLNEGWAPSILRKGGFARDDSTLQDFIPLESVGLGDKFLDYVVHSEPLDGERDRTLVSLLDYTLAGLAQQASGRGFAGLSDPSVLHHAQHLLVVSEGISVEDFCWFWNLRSQRYLLPRTKLPLWLPREVVEARTDDMARLFPPRKSDNVPEAFVLSKTIPREQLERLAARLSTGLGVATTDLHRFYDPEFLLGIRDQREVFFDQGRVRVPSPAADVVKYCNPVREYYYVDVELAGYKLPRLNVTRWGASNLALYRVSRTGLSFVSRQGTTTGHFDFTAPTRWEMLQTLAEIAGYEVEPSDKGRIAERLLQLVGGVDRVWPLSGRTVYRLFDQLAEVRQAKEFKARLRGKFRELSVEDPDSLVEHIVREIASERHERVLQTFGHMRNTLAFKSSKVARRLLDWLIQRRLVFRGTELPCPVCGTKQWLYVDSISSRMQCAGCQQTVDTPLDVDTTQWQYRVNTLCARAHEQGVIPHLLTLSHAVGQNSPASERVVGWFPGIRLQAREGVEAPLRDMEIDVAWIEDGHLVIGECKTNGRELSGEEVAAYLEIAQLMKCERVVLSALDDFRDLDPEVCGLIDNASISIQRLTGEQLFDQFPGRSILAQHAPDRVASPGEAFETHLEAFLNRARNAA